MDTEALKEVSDSLRDIRHLKKKLAQDAEEIETSVQGQMLEAYREAIAEVARRLQKVEEQLVDVRDRLLAEMDNT